MNILVNGDSYSAPDESNSAYSDHLIGTVTNIAQQGCSNDRIFRSTIEYCLNNKPDFVLIGWSFVHRQEVTHNFKLKTLDWVLDTGRVDDCYKMLVDYQWNHEKLLTDFYTQVCILSEWLSCKNIKYKFFSAADNSFSNINHYSNLLNSQIAQKVINNTDIIDLHNWNIKSWAEKNNIQTKPSGHLLLSGQQKFAEYINDNFIR